MITRFPHHSSGTPTDKITEAGVLAYRWHTGRVRFQMCPDSCPALRDFLLAAPGSTDHDRCDEPGLPCADRQPCLAVAAAGTAPHEEGVTPMDA
jgi:hypothetical protein